MPRVRRFSTGEPQVPRRLAAPGIGSPPLATPRPRLPGRGVVFSGEVQCLDVGCFGWSFLVRRARVAPLMTATVTCSTET